MSHELGPWGLFRNRPLENGRLVFGPLATDITGAMRRITQNNCDRQDVTAAVFHLVKTAAATATAVRDSMQGFAALTAALEAQQHIGAVRGDRYSRRMYIPAGMNHDFPSAPAVMDETQPWLDLIAYAAPADSWQFVIRTAGHVATADAELDGFVRLGTLITGTVEYRNQPSDSQADLWSAAGANALERHYDAIALSELPVAVERITRSLPLYGRV